MTKLFRKNEVKPCDVEIELEENERKKFKLILWCIWLFSILITFSMLTYGLSLYIIGIDRVTPRSGTPYEGTLVKVNCEYVGFTFDKIAYGTIYLPEKNVTLSYCSTSMMKMDGEWYEIILMDNECSSYRHDDFVPKYLKEQFNNFGDDIVCYFGHGNRYDNFELNSHNKVVVSSSDEYALHRYTNTITGGFFTIMLSMIGIGMYLIFQSWK